MTKLAAVVAAAFLGLNGYLYYVVETGENLPSRTSFADFPQDLGAWHCLQPLEMEDGIVRRLGVTDYLICDFVHDEEPFVNVYVGYHERQVREGAKSFAESSIHPPRHCLPGSGWNITDSSTVTLDVPGLPGGPALVNRLVIAKGNHRQIVYYWYHSRGRVIAIDVAKILYMFWDRATRQRSDGSLVRFTTPIGRDGADPADARIEDLAGALLPHLADFVPE